MTDERALQIYDEFFADPYKSSSCVYDAKDRESMAREVRDMLAAPSLSAAMKIIEWWGNRMKLCRAMRAKYDAEGRAKP